MYIGIFATGLYQSMAVVAIFAPAFICH